LSSYVNLARISYSLPVLSQPRSVSVPSTTLFRSRTLAGVFLRRLISDEDGANRHDRVLADVRGQQSLPESGEAVLAAVFPDRLSPQSHRAVVAGLAAGVAGRNEADRVAAIGEGEASREPDDVPQVGGRFDVDPAEAMHRGPVVAAANDDLKDGAEARSSVRNPLECFAIDEAGGGRRLLQSLLAQLGARRGLPGSDALRRLDHQPHPLLR